MTAYPEQGGQPGTSRETGRTLTFDEHITQSLRDIFTTPIGSRIQRRDYGSYFFALMDSPMNDAGLLRVRAVLIDAANKWEPRIRITNVQAEPDANGKLHLSYTYTRGSATASSELTI